MKNFTAKWQSVWLRKMEPRVYPRYFRRRPGFAQVVPGHHFYVDEEHSWCEIFYEQVDTGLWMLALEIRGKQDNRYILQPKKSSLGYYSINLFSSSGRMGYKAHNNIQWVNEQVCFIGPGATCEIYQEKDTVLNCCRMIFTSKYLAGLANIDEDHLAGLDLDHVMMADSRYHLHRIATKAELFLKSRLFNVLKYDRAKYHYRASLLSNIFELTAFFFKLSVEEKAIDRTTVEDHAYPMLKAAKMLEQMVSQKFPGITTLAEGCNVSVSKLKRDFKKMHGIPPLEYFRNLQIIYITSVLNKGEMTVKELAMSLGFKKSCTFIVWWRKITQNDQNDQADNHGRHYG